jgi:hypothetical protein
MTDLELTREKVDSSQNITFLQSKEDQVLYLLAKDSLFLFMASVNSGFLVALWDGRPRFSSSRCWIVLIEMLP